MTVLTQAQLKELLSYDPETGIFIWIVGRTGKAKKGTRAGRLKGDGYRAIGIFWKRYIESRLAFLYMEGYFPEHEVDHINGIRDDNRWCNLRHATKICNSQNSKIFTSNTSGYTGVSWEKEKKRWASVIIINKKTYRLGRYKDKLEAALVRIACEDCHPDFHCDERCENRIKVFADLKRSILDSKLDLTP